MFRKLFVLATIPFLILSACQEMESKSEGMAEFTEDGKLKRPDATNWVFVSSSASAVAPSGGGGDSMMAGGNDMMAEEDPKEKTETPAGRFDIIQIDPKAWDHFQKNGTFPEGTVFAMSFYSMHGRSMDSDRFWADQLQGMEVSVKDSTRFEEGWGFFRFEGDSEVAEAFPKERCFACHEERGATDKVFTQLYAKFQK